MCTVCNLTLYFFYIFSPQRLRRSPQVHLRRNPQYLKRLIVAALNVPPRYGIHPRTSAVEIRQHVGHASYGSKLRRVAASQRQLHVPLSQTNFQTDHVDLCAIQKFVMELQAQQSRPRWLLLQQLPIQPSRQLPDLLQLLSLRPSVAALLVPSQYGIMTPVMAVDVTHVEIVLIGCKPWMEGPKVSRKHVLKCLLSFPTMFAVHIVTLSFVTLVSCVFFALLFYFYEYEPNIAFVHLPSIKTTSMNPMRQT